MFLVVLAILFQNGVVGQTFSFKETKGTDLMTQPNSQLCLACNVRSGWLLIMSPSSPYIT